MDFRKDIVVFAETFFSPIKCFLHAFFWRKNSPKIFVNFFDGFDQMLRFSAQRFPFKVIIHCYLNKPPLEFF